FYDVTVTNADGCEDVSSIFVQQPAAPVTVSITEDRPVTCFGDSDGVLAAQPMGPGTVFSYRWSNGAAARENTGLNAGLYSVTVSNELGCEGSGSYALAQPDLITASLEIEHVNCRNIAQGGAIFIENVRGGTGAYSYSKDGAGFGSAPLFTGLLPGSYDVRIRDERGCTYPFPATVDAPPVLTVSLGEDLLLPLGDSVLLSAETNSPAPVFSWTSSEGDLPGTAQELSVRPLVGAAYTVTVFDTLSFCSVSDVVWIMVDKTRRVFVPNAFSPNEDGYNDRFLVFSGSDVSMVRSFSVFDRSGGMVFRQTDLSPNDPAAGWDGTVRGRHLNPGIFVWVAEIEFVDGEVEVFRGDVMVLR
ncbi:MAG TPA: gliding motility-associated C-terminal domain-containing protein, partial [Saprospiraceae bacterium]|nr:gliding motility-associated C-terminal domain-containing protein [Saprospiraceae bacterium]